MYNVSINLSYFLILTFLNMSSKTSLVYNENINVWKLDFYFDVLSFCDLTSFEQKTQPFIETY